MKKEENDRPAAPAGVPDRENRDESPRPDHSVTEGFREWAEAEREEARRLERYQKQRSTNTEFQRGPAAPEERRPKDD